MSIGSNSCAGTASEPDYVNALKRLPSVRNNTAINIEIDPAQGVPLTLVKMAIERAEDDDVDECRCVFDVEWPRHHPHLDQAIRLAREHGIRLAISNPCFELWLILHFDDQASFIETRPAERRSRELDGRTGRRIDGDRYEFWRRSSRCRRGEPVGRSRLIPDGGSGVRDVIQVATSIGETRW